MTNEDLISASQDLAEGLLRSAAAKDEQTILEIARRIIEQHHRSR